jgi:tetratricopeptide (TPR) repeat protein
MDYDRQSQLEKALRRLPEQYPPADLHGRIMRGLAAEKKSRSAGFFRWGCDLLKNSFSPLAGVLTGVCLAIAFYGGFQVGRSSWNLENKEARSGFKAAKMNGEAYFYLARSLLAAGEPQKALQALQHAAAMRYRPEYGFWRGMVYYALGDLEKERESYQQLLRQRPDFLPARLNLAHNYLENRQLEKAKELYGQVLRVAPGQEKARYNRALVFHLQGKVDEEIRAWKDFLFHFRKGSLAFQAVRHLHEHGDYTYRIYRIGYRTLILNQDALLSEYKERKEREVDYLSRQLEGQPPAELNIVVFFRDNTRQAKKLSLDIREMLERRLSPGIRKETIRGSWFGIPEELKKEDGTVFQLSKGVLIFGGSRGREKQEERV